MKTTTLPLLTLTALTAWALPDGAAPIVVPDPIEKGARMTILAQVDPNDGWEAQPGALPGAGRGNPGRNMTGVRMQRVRTAPAPAIRTLVVNPAADAQVIGQATEDLSVMSRLLNKEVEKEVGAGGNRVMGISITGWSSETKAPEAVYLEGHGALFTLNVNFPLTPESAEKAEKREADAPDSDWEKARRELFGGGPAGDHAQVWMMQGFGNQTPEYDPDKVETLKRTVLGVLQHAKNIRMLKPTDNVTVAVLSYPSTFGGGGAGGFATGHVSVSMTGVAGEPPKTVTKTFDSNTDSARQSTLTIQVKKLDADSFAAGKLTLDEFKKKAAIAVY